MKRNVRKFALIFAGLALLAQASCAKKSTANAEKELTTIRFANLAAGLGSAYHMLGIEHGIFEKYGIDLQVINFQKGGAEAAAGIASGQVDMGSFGTPILTGISKGLPIKIVAAPANKEMNFVLVAANDIAAVEDLKGRIVATGALGGGNHQSFVKIIEAHGLKESDINVVATGGTDPFLIIKSGRVAAVQTEGAPVLHIESEGAGHTLAKAKDYYGDYEHSYVFATNDFIENHPEAVSDFLKASRESHEYARDHFDELVEAGKPLVGFDEAVIRKFYEEDIAKWDLTFQVNVTGAANAVEIIKELGEINPDVYFDETTWVDKRFLEGSSLKK